MPNVLLADADRELRDSYAGFLADHGHRADTAESGLQCVAQLRRQVPDLLILDLDLPWGGGDGVLGFLREEPQFLPERIILTAPRESARGLHGLALPPVVQVLTKPFSLYALLEHTPGIGMDEPEFSPAGAERPGILVVDDEAALRDLLQRHLESHGYRVWTAASGDAALDHCCDHGEDIAVVLLDVQMPGLDGPQTLEGIRAFDSDKPVCFMTGGPGPHRPGDLLAQGARHVFRKPFHLPEIIRVVRSLSRERAEAQHA